MWEAITPRQVLQIAQLMIHHMTFPVAAVPFPVTSNTLKEVPALRTLRFS